MSTAIISITEQGNRLTLKIHQSITDSHCYTLLKYSNEALRPIPGKLSEYCKHLFSEYQNLVFIMATGIVVRSIAPYLKSKTKDPAVVVIDDKGKHVISLLSGHLGGANDLALQIAELIDAEPVITTASDVNELPSVDMLAKEHNLLIDSMEGAKIITSLIVNKKNVAIKDEFHILPELNIYDSELPADGEIIVTNRIKTESQLPYAKLLCKNIAMGIGCKKDTAPQLLQEFIETTLAKYNIDKRCIHTITSIDIKKEERAIVKASQWLNIPFVTYSSQELSKVEHLFTGSDFVKKQVGVASVSATSAWLAAKQNAQIICEKESHEGITISLMEQNTEN